MGVASGLGALKAEPVRLGMLRVWQGPGLHSPASAAGPGKTR